MNHSGSQAFPHITMDRSSTRNHTAQFLYLGMMYSHAFAILFLTTARSPDKDGIFVLQII